MEPWGRYASIVDDPEAFRRVCRRPLPSVVRVNPIKATTDRAIAALAAADVGVERREWSDHVLELDTMRPGRTWPYQHGWIHGQEEISQLPATILDPEPGDLVWDAAAAPGGKATQLASLVRGEGIVVANDVNLGRMSALRTNADRLGVDNLVVTNRDARTYSLDRFEFDAFDAALVDAPCSGEGTIRKNPAVFDEWSEAHVRSIASVQTGILRRAVQLTRPGGVVIYATCTFAPEENEGVLSAVLADESVTLEPFEHPLEHAPGVTSWQGTDYHPAVRHAKRFYPHHNETGGFFCAKLRVHGDEVHA